MSTTVDERVVSMQFDNKQFESNVKTSISTVEKLKQSLNFSGMSKGLEEVNAAAKKTDFSGISSGIDVVRTKFSYLQATIQHQLNNIVDSAVSAGKRIASAFTVEPIKAGFQEYETQINSVQTILANTESKGSTLKDVNGALDELNAYADKTIYNFTEMTRNIGTFTAAGVELDTSVAAIKGIANLAAVSGSNSQQASTAMYQLSQALSSGTVKLQDWNSVVNAGMGGQVFQDSLKETARVHGVNIDEMIKKEGSFRETLQNGWLSSEILTETLSKFTGDLNEKQLKSMGYTDEQIKGIMKMGVTANDAATKVKTFTQLMDTLKEAAQSGWTQSWEILVGDFEEAKELWTGVSDYFGEALNKSAELRNNMLEGWAGGGGREMALEAITNAFKGLMEIIKPIKEAFREVFPRMTSNQLLDITRNIRDLTRNFKLTSEQTEALKSTFKGLFSAIDIGVTFLKALASGFVKLLGNVTSFGAGILGITGSIGDWLSGMRDSIKETDVFGKAVDGMVKFLQNGIDKIKEFTSFISEKIKMPGYEGFLKIMQGIWNIIQKIGSKMSEFGSAIGNVIAGAFRSGDINAALDLVNGGIFTAILLGLKKFVGGITDAFDDAGGFLSNIVGILDGVKGCLEAWQQQLKAGALLKIAGAVALLAGSLVILSLVDPEKLQQALTAITVLFADLLGSLAVMNKLNAKYKGVIKTTHLMIGMSIAVLILASALKKVSELSWSEIGVGLAGLAGMTAILVKAAKVMSSTEETVVKGATQMILMAVALKIMASVLKDMSTLSWEGLGKGLSGVGGILLMFVGFQKLMSMMDPKQMTKSSISLLIMGTAMQIFASVCSKFEAISWGGLGKAGAAITGILALATRFALFAGLSSSIVKSSTSLVVMGAAMEIFANVCSKFEAISWEGLGKAGIAIAGILYFAEGFVLLAGLSNGMLKSVVSLTIMAVALEIFADVCKKFGALEWESLAKAGVAIVGILRLSAGFALLAETAPGIIISAASLLVMAAALRIFTPVMTTLGEMSWVGIAKGLVTIAGAFAVMGIAGAVLAPIIPAILGLAGAFALIGVAAITVGAGLLAASIGLAALATVTASSAAAIVASLTIIITGIINLIPAIAMKIGEAILVLCDVIIQGTPAIGEAIRVLLATLVQVLVECVPMLVEGALVLISSALSSLANHIQDIVGSLMQILIGIINGIAENIPSLITAAVNLIGSFFQGVVDALSSIDTDGMLKTIVGIGLLTGIMFALSALAGLVPAAMVGVLGLGVLIAELALVLAAIGGLAQIPGLKWIIGEGGDLLQVIGTAIGQFVGGIVGGIAVGVTSALPEIGTNLANFMKNVTPFVEGAKSITPETLAGVESLVGIVLALTAANILDGIATFITGESSIEKFSKQIVPFGKAMAEFSQEVSGKIDESAVTAAANAGKAIAEMAETIPNSGGLAGFFAGENELDEFCEQIVPFGKAMTEFSKEVAGKIDSSAVTAAANAGKAIAEMSAVIPNSGGLAGFFAGENDLEEFSEQLVSFGTSIGEFSDSVRNVNPTTVSAAIEAGKSLIDMAKSIPSSIDIGAALSKLQDSFPTSLTALGEAIASFSEAVSNKNINKENVEVAKGVLQSVSTIVKQENSILFSEDFKGEQFETNLSYVGNGIAAFCKKFNGGKINPTQASEAVNVVDNVINGLSGDKITEFVSSDANYSLFGTKLSEMGEAVAQFSKSVAGKKINAEAINTVIDSLSKLPDTTKINTFVNADVNYTTFGDKLKNLGTAIVKFSKSISGKKTDISPVDGAITTISKLMNNLPNSETINSFVNNDVDYDSFGEKLASVGKALVAFSKTVTGKKFDAEAGGSAIDLLNRVMNNLPDVDTISEFLSSEVSFKDFGNKLSSMGKAIASFSSSVAGKIKSGDVTSAIKACKSLVNLAKGMGDVDFGKMGSFATGLKKLGNAQVDKFVSAFKNSGEKMNSAGAAMAKNLDEGIKNNLPAIKKSAKSVSESAVNGFKSKQEASIKAGETLVTKFASGITKSESSAYTKGSLLGGKAVSGAKSKYESFVSAGKNLGAGLAAGLEEKRQSLYDKGASLAKSANKGFTDYEEIESPSKVWFGFGGYMIDGLINALSGGEKDVYKSTTKVAKQSTNSLSRALSKVTDMLNMDVNTQPTIRPVLDLSNVTSGVNTMGQMFNMQPSVGVMSNIRSINASMTKRQNGNYDTALLDEMKGLRGDFASADGGMTVTVNLQYDASADANEIANDIAENLRRVARRNK